MRNKNLFWIACYLTLLCGAAWIVATSSVNVAANTSPAIPMPSYIERIRLEVTPANANTSGMTTTVAELLSLMPEQARATLMYKISKQGWSSATRVRFRAVQYLSNGQWKTVPPNWDQQQLVMSSAANCNCCEDPEGKSKTGCDEYWFIKHPESCDC